MKKIKNFKINMRDREIIRSFKNLTNTADLSAETLQSLSAALRFYSKVLCPSIIYENFLPNSLILEQEIIDKEISNKIAAKTVVFATVGAALEDEYKKDENLYGQNTQEMVSAIAVETLQQCRKFADRLIYSEAQEEDCDIMRSCEIQPQNYETLKNLIAIDKIGISFENEKLNPKYSLCELIYWTHAKKKGK